MATTLDDQNDLHHNRRELVFSFQDSMKSAMPTISRFLGITIRMYFDDHGPPHFHAYYGDQSAKIDIETLGTLAGQLPRRVRALVLEWAAEHRDQLRENWLLAENHQPLNNIEPLE